MKNKIPLHYFFNNEEISRLNSNNNEFVIRKIAYCSFENRFAKSGGLGAVTTRIIPYFRQLIGIEKVILISPYYPFIMNNAPLIDTNIHFTVKYNNSDVQIDILGYATTGDHRNAPLDEFFLKADGFFLSDNSLKDPYIYDSINLKHNEEILRENALLFSLAVPYAVKALGFDRDILFHLQEWQTAPVALTSKVAVTQGSLISCASALTLHNTFDTYLSGDSLKKIINESMVRTYNQSTQQEGITALQLGLLFSETPVTTVSRNFAKEFTSDILQTQYFAPHLQDIFKEKNVIGIDNGLFMDPPPQYSEKKEFSISDLKTIKKEFRNQLLQILDHYHPPQRFGDLTYKNSSILNLPFDIPIFVMTGRLDTVQKGFDILLHAIEYFKQDEIKVVLAPMPIKKADLEVFEEIARKCHGNITIFPVKMDKGFKELLMGSTFGVMPSVYEPFGSAIEYIVNGTPVIARDTGGLKDQVIHRKSGFLYRENPATYTLHNIDAFVKSAEHVWNRKENPWYNEMVKSLVETMREAVLMYKNNKEGYFQMAYNGLEQAHRFDWKQAADSYLSTFKTSLISK